MCLQLLANGIIDLDVCQNHIQHRGKATLVAKHIVVKSGTVKRNGTPRILAYLDDDSWNGSRFIERALDATNVPKKVRLTVAYILFLSENSNFMIDVPPYTQKKQTRNRKKKSNSK